VGGWLYKLGRMLGPKVRRGLWMAQGVIGSESDLIAAENAAGADLAEEVRRQATLDPDPQSDVFVQSIGSTLKSFVADTRRRFVFAVLATQEPNAFALPGGFIFITRGILELCRWDRSETAMILAHEMAHVIRKHPMERIMESSALSVATRAMPVRGALGGWLRSVGLSFVEKAYSQDRELDADALGLKLASAAGFDGRAGERLMFRLAGLRQAYNLPLGEYFDTHPPFERRIYELRQLLDKQRKSCTDQSDTSDSA
jgi:beta-barrel assembly-enhancing protease